MVNSKGWDWNNASKELWANPSEDSIYLAKKWSEEGAETLLDLGCGLGRHSLYFSRMGFAVTAVDISESGVEHTRRLVAQDFPDCVCMTADMMALPFADNSFDRVFSYHVISHQDTKGVQNVINEIARVLKPGAKAFVTLCSKQHYAFSYGDFPRIDDNTVLKTEGVEYEVPHFFADKEILKVLFSQYDFVSVRHTTECEMGEDESRERSHYYIEVQVKK